MKKKNIAYFVGAVCLAISLLAEPGCSYAGMTGSGGRDNMTQEQRENWRDRSSENDPRIKKVAEKIIDKINPHSWLMKPTKKFAEEYDKYKKRKGNVATGTGVTREKDWK